MHILKWAAFVFLVLINSSCSNNGHAKASYGSAYLGEAEALLEGREFQKAEEMALKALDHYNQALLAEPNNVDFLLVRSRIYFTLFRCKNTLIIERAPEQPRSLVKIPEQWEYIDFDQTLTLAEGDLKKVINSSESLPLEQEAAARGLLGNIYRLSKTSAKLADAQMEKSIEATKRWITELQNPQKKLESHTFKIKRARKQLEEMSMARVEVLLLDGQWSTALNILEQVVAGPDLKYFSIQFNLLENKITGFLNKLKENQEHTKTSREGKLMRYLEKARSKKAEEGDVFYQYNSTELELLQTELQLTLIKNNLIYRIICYHHLRHKENLQQAHNILRSFYPDIDAKLTLALQQSDTNS